MLEPSFLTEDARMRQRESFEDRENNNRGLQLGAWLVKGRAQEEFLYFQSAVLSPPYIEKSSTKGERIKSTASFRISLYYFQN